MAEDPTATRETSQAGHPQARAQNLWLTLLIRGAPILLIYVVWELTALVITSVRAVEFPSPGATLVRLFDLLTGQALLGVSYYRHLTDSLIRWGIGFTFAAILGLSSGLFIGWSRWLRPLLTPIVHMMQNIPSLAWIPVAILLLGLGSEATIFIIFLAGVFAMTINTSAGVRAVNTVHVRAAEMLGTKRFTLFWRVLLPSAMPHILSGLRVGLANGWRALIAAEMVAAQGTGLGYTIFQARWSFDYESAFSGILLIAGIGLVAEWLFSQLEKRTISRWGLSTEVRE